VTAPGPRDTELLLDRLCVRLGFCLAPIPRQQLIDAPPEDPQAFAEAVFVAEGLELEQVPLALYRQVRGIVADAYGQALDDRAR
jgi:hypothetical protein